MSNIKIEEFRGDHNKLYLITNNIEDIYELKKIAKSRFKVANCNLMITFAYVVGNELYLHFLDIPKNKREKARFVYTAFVLNKMEKARFAYTTLLNGGQSNVNITD